MSRRLLLVHAHPDDETITTGGTIAHYLMQGVEVTVLTCTLGEEGEVIGERWAQLVADRADQLGGYRIAELGAALGALSNSSGALSNEALSNGALSPRFLCGAGHWRDSGMAGTPSAEHPRAFVRADPDEAVGAVVEVIRELRPHVVVTYDPVGGYGHPDHIQVHRITTAAVEAAGTDRFPDRGVPWAPDKLYWTVTEDAALESGLADLGEVPADWRMPRPGELPSRPAAEVTAEVDVRAVIDAKRTALAAHATQVLVAPGGRAYTLSNLIAQPVLDREHFVLVHGTRGEVGADGREHDLFAGVEA